MMWIFCLFFIFIINALKEYVCRKGTWMTPDMIFHNLAIKYIGFNVALIALMHLNKTDLRDLIAATGLLISNWIQIVNFSVLVTMKFDGWPRKTIGHNKKKYYVKKQYYVKLCASFQIHWWIQTGFTVQKRSIRVEIGDTVETLYNTINFCWSAHKRHSIARPKGRGMGCLLWVQRATYCVDLSILSSIKYLL